jgi:hypothetical protein
MLAPPRQLTPSAQAAFTTIYVAEAAVPGAVDVYTGAGKPVRRLLNGIYRPSLLDVDPAGSLYVFNGDFTEHQFVSEYGTAATGPMRTLRRGVGSFVGMASTAAGDLFAANGESLGGPLPQVVKFGPRGNQPSVAITASSEPVSMSVDGSDVLYVGNAGNVAEYDGAANGKLLRTITEGIANPTVAAGRSGNLYVGQPTFPYVEVTIREYAPKSTTPLLTFVPNLEPRPAFSVAGMLVSPSGELYAAMTTCKISKVRCAANTGGLIISIYALGKTEPEKTIVAPDGVVLTGETFDRQGNFYAVYTSVETSVSQVNMYAPGSTVGKTLVRGNHLGAIAVSTSSAEVSSYGW